MQDTERRFLCRNGTQRDFEPLPVRVGHRQPENPVPVPACGQRVDQWRKYLGVVADEEPGSSLAGVRIRGRRGSTSGFLPANLVAGVLGGLGFTLVVGPDRLLTDPVLAMLERIGGQVKLARRSLPDSVEVWQVAEDVRVGKGFGDLALVGGVATQ